jgi:hypothetical protein
MRLLQSALLLAYIATPLVFAEHTHVPTPSAWILSLPESN